MGLKKFWLKPFGSRSLVAPIFFVCFIRRLGIQSHSRGHLATNFFVRCLFLCLPHLVAEGARENARKLGVARWRAQRVACALPLLPAALPRMLDHTPRAQLDPLRGHRGPRAWRRDSV